MSTFGELMQKRSKARNTRTVLLHLVEYIDTKFMPKMGGKPELVLLNDEDKTPVPQDAFDDVATELHQRVKALDEVLVEIDDAEPQEAEAKP